jgi:O-antigen ligase
LAGVVAISVMPWGYAVPAGILILGVLGWTFARPVRALSVIILGNLILLSTSEEISSMEVAFGVYLFGYLGYWAWQRVFVDCKPILEHVSDSLLVAFYVVALCTFPVVVLGGESPLWWFRELLTLSQLLLFFPMRDAFREPRGMITIVVMFLGMSCIVAIRNLVNYNAAAAVVSYVWELGASRQAFGDHLFFPAVVMLLSLWVHLRNRHWAFTLVPVFAAFALALALTFSRGFWLAAVIGACLLFWLVGKRERVRLGVAATVAAGLGVLVVALFLGDLGQSVLNALLMRIASAGGAIKDASFVNRLVESNEAIRRILEQPVFGYGVGAMFPRYDVLLDRTVSTLYIHNGYLFLLYKVGIVGTLPYVGFLFVVMWKGVRRAFDGSAEGIPLAIIRGCTAILPAMLIVSFTSNVFIQKQSLLVLSITTACIMSRCAGVPSGRHLES